MDETESTAANFMPKDLIEIICILERDEKCHSYKIIRKRKYFTLVTKFPAKNGESTPSMPTHISVWGYTYPLVFPFGGTCSFLRVHIF